MNTLSEKRKVLLVLRIPPRLTGATLMNSYVAESKLLMETFNIKIERLPHAKTHNEVGKITFDRIISTLRSMIRILMTIYRFKPRFVYFQISPLGGAFLRDLLFVTVIKSTGKTILYHLHGKGINDLQRKFVWRILYKYAFHSEKIICLSRNLTKDIAGVYRGDCFIVPNVIKHEIAELQSKTFGKVLNLLFISNLKISKGLFIFLEVLSLLKSRKIDFQARIVGHESSVSKEQLLAKIKTLGLDTEKVDYVGPKYGMNKWNEYQWAHIMIFPTLNDIWGLVILEAMQAGIPVIASRDGAIPEIIDNNETGYVVEKNRPLEICEKIIFLNNNPDTLRKMGEKGRRKFLDEYSYERFEQKMAETFSTVINA